MRGVAFSEGTDATGLEQTENKKVFGLFWNSPSPQSSPSRERKTGTLPADAKQHLDIVPRPELLRHPLAGRGSVATEIYRHPYTTDAVEQRRTR